MRNEIFVQSDCCGAEMTQEAAQQGICPDCLEHCEATVEIIPVEE